MKHPASISVTLFLVVLAVATSAAAMAGAAAAEENAAKYQLGILGAALGSEEKAKAAILYNYRNVMSGFSARLTPSELEAVKSVPGAAERDASCR
nr:unnamed protein product [Digitaria exilis]CAB3497534.1 unnamed protein product [Digitaria exilis]